MCRHSLRLINLMLLFVILLYCIGRGWSRTYKPNFSCWMFAPIFTCDCYWQFNANWVLLLWYISKAVCGWFVTCITWCSSTVQLAARLTKDCFHILNAKRDEKCVGTVHNIPRMCTGISSAILVLSCFQLIQKQSDAQSFE